MFISAIGGPHIDVPPSNDSSDKSSAWPPPQIVHAVGNSIRPVNDTSDPLPLKRHAHICTARPTEIQLPEHVPIPHLPVKTNRPPTNPSKYFFDEVSIDPDNISPEVVRRKFKDTLQHFDTVFSPEIRL